VSATRAYGISNTQTALLKNVTLWTMTWPQTSEAYCCEFGQPCEPSRRETAPREVHETAGGMPETHHREVPESLCNRCAAESIAVILQLPNPSLVRSATYEESKIGFDLAQNGVVREIFQAPRIPHHSRQEDQCLRWLTMQGIYSMSSRPFVIREYITAEGTRCCWLSPAQIAVHSSTTRLESFDINHIHHKAAN